MQELFFEGTTSRTVLNLICNELNLPEKISLSVLECERILSKSDLICSLRCRINIPEEWITYSLSNKSLPDVQLFMNDIITISKDAQALFFVSVLDKGAFASTSFINLNNVISYDSPISPVSVTLCEILSNLSLQKHLNYKSSLLESCKETIFHPNEKKIGDVAERTNRPKKLLDSSLQVNFTTFLHRILHGLFPNITLYKTTSEQTQAQDEQTPQHNRMCSPSPCDNEITTAITTSNTLSPAATINNSHLKSSHLTPCRCEENDSSSSIHDATSPRKDHYHHNIICNLLDLIRLKPSILLSSHANLLFVLYQIIKVYLHFENEYGFILANVTLRDFAIVPFNLHLSLNISVIWKILKRHLIQAKQLKDNSQGVFSRNTNNNTEAAASQIDKTANKESRHNSCCSSSYKTCSEDLDETISPSHHKETTYFCPLLSSDCHRHFDGVEMNWESRPQMINDPTSSFSSSLSSLTHAWCSRKISNYDYLMAINTIADRSRYTPSNYPMFPWVCDFQSPTWNWRDLSKSKYRLNKGDHQLDLTFGSTTLDGNSRLKSNAAYHKKGSTRLNFTHRHDEKLHLDLPHHIPEILSEITYYSYKARITPKEILCQYVRPRWEPKEYPSSVAAIYAWTPDECIPDFYDDPSIFISIHDDLENLALPEYASSPKEFIQFHRTLLESESVSSSLHEWIDITFGFKLSGIEAVRAKNVSLQLMRSEKESSSASSPILHKRTTSSNSRSLFQSGGVVQLFRSPHPPRISSPNYSSTSFSSSSHDKNSGM